MKYLIVCFDENESVLAWQELKACYSDNAAVTEAFAFAITVDGTDYVEINGEYELGVELVCQIHF